MAGEWDVVSVADAPKAADPSPWDVVSEYTPKPAGSFTDANKQPELLPMLWEGGKEMVQGTLHGAGTVADVLTGTGPGAGSHAERWASNIDTDPTMGGSIDDSKGGGINPEWVSKSYDQTFGTGPLAQTVKERAPQFLEAATTVSGAGELAAGRIAAVRGGRAAKVAEAPVVAKPPGEFNPDAILTAPEAPKAEVANTEVAAPSDAAPEASNAATEQSGPTTAKAFYHGTQNPNGGSVVPSWFTTSADEASGYAGGRGATARDGANVVRTNLDIKKPFVVTSEADIRNVTSGTVEKLKAQGYDGIVYEKPGNPVLAKFTGNAAEEQPRTWAIPFDAEQSSAHLQPKTLADHPLDQPIKGKVDEAGAASYTPEQKAAITDRHWKRVGMEPVTDESGKVVGHNIVDPEAYAKAKADYAAHPESQGGKVINTDIARDLSPDYNPDGHLIDNRKEEYSPEGIAARGTLSAAVHEPSSAFTKQIYADKLAEPLAPGQRRIVMVTGGGAGAGKSSGLEASQELAKLSKEAHVVYDTNLNKYDSAKSKIQQAYDAGHDVHVVYTYRDPAEAAVGTLKRGDRQGRTVPDREIQGTHAGAYPTVKRLIDEHASVGDTRFGHTVVDNSLGKGNQRLVPFTALKGKRYSVPLEEIQGVVKREYAHGNISKRVFNGTLGIDEHGQAPGAGASVAALAGKAEAGVGESGLRQTVREGGTGKPAAGVNASGTAEAAAVSGGKGEAVEGNRGVRTQPGQGQEEVAFTPPAPEGAKTAAGSAKEQADREAALRAIGLKETRHSAVTGDSKETGIDFQTSKLDNAAGKRMAQVIEHERAAVHGYAEDLVRASGGTEGTDLASRRVRGRTIVAPLEGFDKALEGAVSAQYKAADAAAAGKPIQLTGTNDFLQNNKAAFLGTTDGKQLFQGVTARAKELGLTAPNGTFNPATVAQAERLRQYLNENWSPKTARLIAKIKNELDEDVARVGGADVYQASRQVRALRSKLLEEPEGVSSLIGEKGSKNRSVAHEDVPKELASMDADQFDHVVDVLKHANQVPELKAQSAAAIGEVRAIFANGVRDAGTSTQGMWNVKAVNKYLRDNNARMSKVFTPEELRHYKTLNDAGNALRMDRSYPGAAAQGHNFVVGGVVHGIEHGAAAGGALLGHIPGAVVGAAAGKVATKFSERSLAGTVEKRIRKLSE